MRHGKKAVPVRLVQSATSHCLSPDPSLTLLHSWWFVYSLCSHTYVNLQICPVSILSPSSFHTRTGLSLDNGVARPDLPWIGQVMQGCVLEGFATKQLHHIYESFSASNIFMYHFGFMQLSDQFSASACRKRRKLEDLEESKTVNKFADLIGRGQISIAAAADIARNVVPMLSWRTVSLMW